MQGFHGNCRQSPRNRVGESVNSPLHKTSLQQVWQHCAFPDKHRYNVHQHRIKRTSFNSPASLQLLPTEIQSIPIFYIENYTAATAVQHSANYGKALDTYDCAFLRAWHNQVHRFSPLEQKSVFIQALGPTHCPCPWIRGEYITTCLVLRKMP